MDLATSGLAATNEKFNSILSQIDSTTKTMKELIESDASAAAEAIGADLSLLSGELRSLVPQGLALPNINLQSQLSSLSGLADPTQAAGLLSSITSSFGPALTTAGFSLDSLVASAGTAVAAGKSLSFDIPNFEKTAGGAAAAFQKSIGVKLPSIDPVKEAKAIFNANPAVADLTQAVAAAVKSTSDTLPEEDTSQYTITEETTNITKTSITTAVTTALNAIEKIGNKLKRKNISASGFTSRVGLITETFLSGDLVITLSDMPVMIMTVSGFDELGNIWDIGLAPLSNDNKVIMDEFTVSGKIITIKESGKRTYTKFLVRYAYNNTYDPTYKVDEVVVA